MLWSIRDAGRPYGTFLRGRRTPAKPKCITHFRPDPDLPPTLTPEEAAQLEAMPINYSDIPELPDDFWTRHPP
jgi:hypothetical protein